MSLKDTRMARVSEILENVGAVKSEQEALRIAALAKNVMWQKQAVGALAGLLLSQGKTYEEVQAFVSQAMLEITQVNGALLAALWGEQDPALYAERVNLLTHIEKILCDSPQTEQ